jgi:hypothetical protein
MNMARMGESVESSMVTKSVLKNDYKKNGRGAMWLKHPQYEARFVKTQKGEHSGI